MLCRLQVQSWHLDVNVCIQGCLESVDKKELSAPEEVYLVVNNGSVQTVDGSPVLSASEGSYVSVPFLIVKQGYIA